MGFRTGHSNMVLTRVNAKYFDKAAEGSPVSVAGRLSADAVLTTTDGGKLDLAGGDLAAKDGFVEIVGRKEGKTVSVERVLFLGESLDVEMWDGAVEMMHHPGVGECFA